MIFKSERKPSNVQRCGTCECQIGDRIREYKKEESSECQQRETSGCQKCKEKKRMPKLEEVNELKRKRKNNECQNRKEWNEIQTSENSSECQKREEEKKN